MIFGSKWREEKQAEKIGKQDGGMNRPSADWKGGPTPYLMQLFSKYEGHVFDLRLKATALAGQSLHADDMQRYDVNHLRSDLAQHEAELSAIDNQLETAHQEKRGSAEDSVGGRAGRHREISSFVYVAALVSLVVGEFLVTVPAAEMGLGDESMKLPLIGTFKPVILVALSVSVLSVVLAHLFGITLKSRIGRDRPQPSGVSRGFAFLAGLMVIALLFLSALRSEKVRGVSSTLMLSQSTFGTLLFFVLQLTFIGAATGLSFYYHSEIDQRISLLHRERKALRSKAERIRQRIAKKNQTKFTPRKLEIQLQALSQEYQLLSSRYKYLANLYINSNLQMQPKNHLEPGPGLTPIPLPELEINSSDFISRTAMDNERIGKLESDAI